MESTLRGVGVGWLLCHSHRFTDYHASQKMVERTGLAGKARLNVLIAKIPLTFTTSKLKNSGRLLTLPRPTYTA